MSSPHIPDKYAELADIIRSTQRDTVKIKLIPGSNLKPWQSKIGGIPYLPLNKSYPVDSKGYPLLFLAQLNFSEVPHMEGYPEKGILQFFIDGQDDCMGLDTNEHKVLYIADVEQVEANLQDVIPIVDCPFAPYEKNKSYSMEFSLEKQYISVNDFRFGDFLNFKNDYDKYDDYNRLYDPFGHKIGGYPFFTQTDPRDESDEWKDFELLFQLDSDEYILWGDMGVGGFFIKPDDLKKLDFSNVRYNWDCC